jgi:hypothetical protein
MSLRSELETRLANWASAQSPPIPVAWEGFPFVPPQNGGPYIQPFLLANTVTNATVDAARTRTRGNFQINVWVKDGKGSKVVEDLSNTIAALYPVLPKVGTVSVESPPQTSAAFTNVDWRVITISISYRQELKI